MAAKAKPTDRERNLTAYNRQRTELEATHRGEYVAVAGGRIVGVYSTFDEAWAAIDPSKAATLIFQIGHEPMLSPLRISSNMRKLGRLLGQ